jgi:hypothetical protein
MHGTLHVEGKGAKVQAVVGDCFFGRLNSWMVEQFLLLLSAPESSGCLSVEERHSIVMTNPVGLGLAEVQGDW